MTRRRRSMAGGGHFQHSLWILPHFTYLLFSTQFIEKIIKYGFSLQLLVLRKNSRIKKFVNKTRILILISFHETTSWKKVLIWNKVRVANFTFVKGVGWGNFVMEKTHLNFIQALTPEFCGYEFRSPLYIPTVYNLQFFRIHVIGLSL